MPLLQRISQFLTQRRFQAILLELVIVFIGVYLAFLLNSYQENQKSQKEADKILSTLKIELEYFRIQFPGRATYQYDERMKWDSLAKEDSYIQFYNWRYVQPQYDYSILEYALNTQENSIVDFELYTSLSQLFERIKQLENMEITITNIGLEYRDVSNRITNIEELKSFRERVQFFIQNYGLL
ncbi:MAG: hypothetical protein AAFO07_06000, partial [Bacteroidota bacterium]